jgi:glycine cleavage system H protein
MNTPIDFLFTKQHAWVNIKENIAIVGITDELQEILVSVDEIVLPKKGDEVEMDIECVTLNYDGGTYELPSPLTGRITKINHELRYSPELIHSSCYNDGWLFEMEYDESDELDMLYSAVEYEDEIENMPDL